MFQEGGAGGRPPWDVSRAISDMPGKIARSFKRRG
jgi:hypothetical protein